MLIVQKYGGTSLGNAQKIADAAERLVQLARQGNRVVAVVSAQGHTTDQLIHTAREINPEGSLREIDACIASGEQISAALVAMAIEALRHPAISLTGWQAGIRTDDVHGNAVIRLLSNGRIVQELEQGKIVVVAGFQGIDRQGNITTLGRGGSDITAVALAALLGAQKCQIYTDVGGVYDRDPREYPDAVRFDRISYKDMLELIAGGAQVLHDRSVEFAREYGVEIQVLSAFEPGPGTWVVPED